MSFMENKDKDPKIILLPFLIRSNMYLALDCNCILYWIVVSATEALAFAFLVSILCVL